MAKTETLEDFYRQKMNWLPENLKKDIGHFNEGVMKTTNFTSPKHGAVVHLTSEEAETLRNYWEHRENKTKTKANKNN